VGEVVLTTLADTNCPSESPSPTQQYHGPVELSSVPSHCPLALGPGPPSHENIAGVTDGQTDFGFERLHHVQLAVPAGGEQACRDFWGGVLGLRELDKPPVLAGRGGCWFAGGGLEVHLGVEPEFTPARKAHPGILVAEFAGLTRLADRLTAAGHAVRWDDDFPGFHRFYTGDPFGNRLEFLQPR
jgi:catechol 2,3-dioxygenase-like lactoylglutathione lyase family enzyme